MKVYIEINGKTHSTADINDEILTGDALTRAKLIAQLCTLNIVECLELAESGTEPDWDNYPSPFSRLELRCNTCNRLAHVPYQGPKVPDMTGRVIKCHCGGEYK